MSMSRDWELLAGAAPEESQALLDRARKRRFDTGEIVFHAGDPADTLHLIRSGRFAVRVMTEFGDVATLTVLASGQAFGELALLSPGEPRSATIMALEPSETLSIHELDFKRLRSVRPQTYEVMVAILAAQVRRLSAHLVEALYVPADTRVRRRLLELARMYADDDGVALVPLTQEDLASMAGTSRATVNKVLREEEEKGAIELGRGRTTINDTAALSRRAHPMGGG
jgi:CRP/FNR family transcriptional regulator, cyclic AMP receptor protein